jgi:magnesium-dependent phosphatase-1
MSLQLIAFDLDGTIWAPDMYELWGGGGIPFTAVSNSDNSVSVLKDRAGNLVELLGVSSRVLLEMKHHHIISAFVSTCDEPKWAKQCLQQFKTDEGSILASCAEQRMQLIYNVWSMMIICIGKQTRSLCKIERNERRRVQRHAVLR